MKKITVFTVLFVVVVFFIALNASADPRMEISDNFCHCILDPIDTDNEVFVADCNPYIIVEKSVKEIVEEKKVRAEVVGMPVMPFLIFGKKSDYEKIWLAEVYERGDPGTDEDKRLMNAFYSETIKGGVFFHPRHHWFPCLSTSEEDVKKTLQVAAKALDIAKKSI